MRRNKFGDENDLRTGADLDDEVVEPEQLEARARERAAAFAGAEPPPRTIPPRTTKGGPGMIPDPPFAVSLRCPQAPEALSCWSACWTAVLA